MYMYSPPSNTPRCAVFQVITYSGLVGDREIDGLRVACWVPVLCSSLAGTPRPRRANLLLVCQLLRQRSPPQFGLRGLAHG